MDPLPSDKENNEKDFEHLVLQALRRIKDNNDYNHKLNSQILTLQADNFRLTELNNKADTEYRILCEETKRLQATAGATAPAQASSGSDLTSSEHNGNTILVVRNLGVVCPAKAYDV